MRGSAGAAALLAASAAIATLRWAGMAQDPQIGFLVLLQFTHGLTFGATHLSSVFLLARIAPAGMLAQAQAWLAASWAGIMAVLTTLAGYLYGEWGEHVYCLMAAVSAAGFLLLIPVALGFRGRTSLGLPLAGDAEQPVQRLG